jgi:hypothetical protein
MKELHYYKESKKEDILSPDFSIEVNPRLLLVFLQNLSKWISSRAYFSCEIQADEPTFYVLYRDVAFTDPDFCQAFGPYLVLLGQRWPIDVFGTELISQEAVELTVSEEEGKYAIIQRTVSGHYAESISSLCLKIKCQDKEERDRLFGICQSMDWDKGILVADFDPKIHPKQEWASAPYQNACYYYLALSDEVPSADLLDALSFTQKMKLWRGFLQKGFDYTEFSWIYDAIAHRTLNNRTEWELALYAALKEQAYRWNICESEFECYDGQGKRCYYSFNSEQNSERAFLKLLFPLNN